MAGSCFFRIKDIEKKPSEKNELIVFRLFAQILSTELLKQFLLVLFTILLLIAMANVFYSNIKWGLERLKK